MIVGTDWEKIREKKQTKSKGVDGALFFHRAARWSNPRRHDDTSFNKQINFIQYYDWGTHAANYERIKQAERSPIDIQPFILTIASASLVRVVGRASWLPFEFQWADLESLRAAEHNVLDVSSFGTTPEGIEWINVLVQVRLLPENLLLVHKS